MLDENHQRYQETIDRQRARQNSLSGPTPAPKGDKVFLGISLRAPGEINGEMAPRIAIPLPSISTHPQNYCPTVQDIQFAAPSVISPQPSALPPLWQPHRRQDVPKSLLRRR